MLEFAKGHGTLNDFVLVTDPDDTLGLTDDDIRFLCDRRAGIGGDGILRAVRARHIPEWQGDPGLWFMDYRNADASIAEMCGNGARVFLRYLKEEGLVPAEVERLEFGTRAGARVGEYLPDGRLRVWMGCPAAELDAVRVSADGDEWAASAVDVGNPHAVSVLPPGVDLGALDLTRQPVWTPAGRFPTGANLEFVTELGPDHARMRVYERGVGETWSCGTGTVAAAATLAAAAGRERASYRIEVPGGEVLVELADGQAWLSGPAEIVARGTVRLPREENA